MKGPARRLPRIIPLNYAIRTAAFAYCFVVMGLLFWERQMSVVAWSMLALQFLVYPHLIWLRARSARDPRRAEMQHLYLDSVLIGAWAAMVGFPTWITYGGLFSVALNSAVMRGWPGAALAVAGFCGGALVWIVPMGFTHFPQSSDLVSMLCFLGSLGYSCGVGVVVFGQNARLRAARDELREGERLYRLITEHAGDLVAMVDRDARWLYTSPSYRRIFLEEDLAAGRDAFRSLHEDDQFRVRGAIQAVMRSGEACRLRMRLHTVTGNVRLFEAMVHAVSEEDGAGPKISGAVIASRDITELSERDEQIEILGHAFERMAEAMMITNASGRILTVNQSFARITGHAPEEVLGRQESEFRAAMQPESWYDELYAVVLRTGHWDGVSWCRRRDETLYREWRSVSAVRDADGRITYYVALFRELDNPGADRTLPDWSAKSA